MKPSKFETDWNKDLEKRGVLKEDWILKLEELVIKECESECFTDNKKAVCRFNEIIKYVQSLIDEAKIESYQLGYETGKEILRGDIDKAKEEATFELKKLEKMTYYNEGYEKGKKEMLDKCFDLSVERDKYVLKIKQEEREKGYKVGLQDGKKENIMCLDEKMTNEMLKSKEWAKVEAEVIEEAVKRGKEEERAKILKEIHIGKYEGRYIKCPFCNKKIFN